MTLYSETLKETPSFKESLKYPKRVTSEERLRELKLHKDDAGKACAPIENAKVDCSTSSDLAYRNEPRAVRTLQLNTAVLSRLD